MGTGETSSSRGVPCEDLLVVISLVADAAGRSSSSVRSIALMICGTLDCGLPIETPSSLEGPSAPSSSLTSNSSSTSDESGQAKVKVSFLVLYHTIISPVLIIWRESERCLLVGRMLKGDAEGTSRDRFRTSSNASTEYHDVVIIDNSRFVLC